MTGPTASGLFLGLFAVLLGVALTAAALRRRRRRALYGETYASSGGVAYTVVQIGCAALFVMAGATLMVLAVIFTR